MENTEKEKLIDKLLVFMNDEIEQHGVLLNQVEFDFQEKGEDLLKFIELTGIDADTAITIFNSCISRGYIKRKLAHKDYGIIITEEGQGRAISSRNQNKDLLSNVTGDINIGVINSNGQFQVGHSNSQQFEINIKDLLEKINKSDFAQEEKIKARKSLKDFINQPIVTTILGATAGSLLSLL